jgi:3D (Asp-Asp-Asp) domain-containing protein
MLSRSLRRRAVVTGLAALGFAFLYQVTAFDSRYAARQAELRENSATPTPGARLRFTATAYCKGTTTASGVGVRSGIAAADPALLPVGSVVQVDSLAERYNGVYTIMDTGPKVQGRLIDVYMWSCYEALEFGRRPIRLTVLRLGWNPRASSPGVVGVLFKQREAVRESQQAPDPQPKPDVAPSPPPSAPPPGQPGGVIRQPR